MNETRINGLGYILKRIGNFNISSFDGRLTLQKTIYLLQAFGLYMGYHFHWYLRGPYSMTLGRDGFELEKIFENLPSGKFAEDNDERRFGDFLDFISIHKNNPKILEILASIHFLKEINDYIDKNEIFEKVKEKNILINENEFNLAWDYLKKNNLIRE